MEFEPRDSGPFSCGVVVGLAFNAEAGLLSMLGAACILVLILLRLYRDSWPRWEALDFSIFALFVSELIQGMADALDLKWVIEGQANKGTFCTTQGVMQQLGAASVALVTLTIALQTFVILWKLQPLNRTISAIVLGVEFLFVILFVAITFRLNTDPKNSKFYATPSPYWCWIDEDKKFKGERIGGQYLWYWLTLFVSLLTYVPLSLLLGDIIKPGERWYLPAEGGGLQRPNLWTIILYPILYCVLIIPATVVRWTPRLIKKPVAVFVASTFFSLSGFFNAFLYLYTRAIFFRPGQN